MLKSVKLRLKKIFSGQSIMQSSFNKSARKSVKKKKNKKIFKIFDNIRDRVEEKKDSPIKFEIRKTESGNII